VGFVTMRRLLHLNQVCEADLDEKEGARCRSIRCSLTP
jgi:hypothetical protein